MDILKSYVEADSLSKGLAEKFDYTFDGSIEFNVPNFNLPKDKFNIGLIVGASGSGKSTILKSISGDSEDVSWDNSMSVASHFDSVDDAIDKFSAVGFNSVPSWFKPYNVLSNGERFRVELARKISNDMRIDEFTSVVDRNVAKSCSFAIQKHIRKNNIEGTVFASCHRDIVEWLMPDWVYDTDLEKFLQRRSLRRPSINLEVLPCGFEAWPTFSKHHYLSKNLNKSAKHWICFWQSNVVGFASAMTMPSGTVKNAYRGHRTVVLPDFQGLGIGMALSDSIGEIHLTEGKRYFSKTTHPKMGQYRNNSLLWRATSKNMRTRNPKGKNKNIRWQPRKVFSYSHEYIGHKDG